MTAPDGALGMTAFRNRHPLKLGRAARTAAVAGVMLAVTAGVSWAANYTTYYCGDASNYCTVYSSAPESTASVAQRYNNNIQCANTCHTHVYYYSSGTGSYGFAYTSGGTSASYGASGGGNYVYSRCITDADYGSNTARCWTEWYT